MPEKRIALVTGANQGVGLQVAKELVANGVTVLIGSRNFERGEVWVIKTRLQMEYKAFSSGSPQTWSDLLTSLDGYARCDDVRVHQRFHRGSA